MKNVTTEEMIKMFGEEGYIRANEEFAGRKHHFPKNLKLLPDEERNRLIIETMQAGVPADVVAEDYGLSRSRVYDIYLGK